MDITRPLAIHHVTNHMMPTKIVVFLLQQMFYSFFTIFGRLLTLLNFLIFS